LEGDIERVERFWGLIVVELRASGDVAQQTTYNFPAESPSVGLGLNVVIGVAALEKSALIDIIGVGVEFHS
jgi:hypothetical protein